MSNRYRSYDGKGIDKLRVLYIIVIKTSSKCHFGNMEVTKHKECTQARKTNIGLDFVFFGYKVDMFERAQVPPCFELTVPA